MTTESPTQLPGDKLRKAIDAFSELRKKHPEKSKQELVNTVAQQHDLSPLECEFLLRQLK